MFFLIHVFGCRYFRITEFLCIEVIRSTKNLNSAFLDNFPASVFSILDFSMTCLVLMKCEISLAVWWWFGSLNVCKVAVERATGLPAVSENFCGSCPHFGIKACLLVVEFQEPAAPLVHLGFSEQRYQINRGYLISAPLVWISWYPYFLIQIVVKSESKIAGFCGSSLPSQP